MFPLEESVDTMELLAFSKRVYSKVEEEK